MKGKKAHKAGKPKKAKTGLAARTVVQLRKEAKKKGLKLSKSGKPLKKSQLVAALRK